MQIEVMQQAADITCESFNETIRASHPFVLESQLGAKFDFESRIRGSERPAYPPVIAGIRAQLFRVFFFIILF